IWRRIGDDWPVSKSASASFALSALIIIAMTAAFVLAEPQDLSVLRDILWGTGGVLAAVSVFFLWGGMWQYWIRCDSSSHAARRAWFFVLFVGLWYGAILYYALVYVPRTRSLRMTFPR